ncbi:hypothetical protein CAEBREN_23250 [Caenorhabditis brenneri]|uniref:F-box domain-containing protein n=1 Tax=Caenorhabditis brenneri TaxID=135651 RepID=G0MC44_CAEBE|nr:hypothetical protein CAEBREN_23250 [Caenorhabditis brenneri]
MAVVAPGFPLLRLPTKARNHAVKTMDILDRISLSLVSKVTKSIVIRCGVNTSFISFTMRELFIVTLTRQNLNLTWCLSQRHKTWDGSNPVELVAANVVQVRKSRTENYRWKKKGFEIKDWINHFLDITRIRCIHKIFFDERGERFDVDSVARTVNGFNLNALVVSDECSSKYANSIFQKVHTNSISLDLNLFPQKVILEKVVIQNCKRVYTQTEFPIKLNDLLIMNCGEFVTKDPRGFSMKTFNRFLKIWKTGFNRRLKRFMIEFGGHFAPDKNVILKGIDHIEVTPARFDFRGANGSRATLLFQHRLSRIMLLVSDGNFIQL